MVSTVLLYIRTCMYMPTSTAGMKALCGRLTGHTPSSAASLPPVPTTGRLLCGRRRTVGGIYSTNSENTSLLVSALYILGRIVHDTHVRTYVCIKQHFHLCKSVFALISLLLVLRMSFLMGPCCCYVLAVVVCPNCCVIVVVVVVVVSLLLNPTVNKP